MTPHPPSSNPSHRRARARPKGTRRETARHGFEGWLPLGFDRSSVGAGASGAARRRKAERDEILLNHVRETNGGITPPAVERALLLRDPKARPFFSPAAHCKRGVVHWAGA